MLDFTQPVAVMALMVLQYIPDSDQPQQIVSGLMDAVPSDSSQTPRPTSATGPVVSPRRSIRGWAPPG
jgi:hypothetical protein